MPWHIHIHPHPQPFEQRLTSVKDKELGSTHLLTVVKRTFDKRQKMLRRSPSDWLAFAKRLRGICHAITKTQFCHLFGYILQTLMLRTYSYKDLGLGICSKPSFAFQAPYRFTIRSLSFLTETLYTIRKALLIHLTRQ